MSPCKWIQLDDGTTVHLKLSNPRRTKCRFCKKWWGSRLCDFPLGNGRTCDAPMCPACATRTGEDADLCPNHKNAAPQRDLFAEVAR